MPYAERSNESPNIINIQSCKKCDLGKERFELNDIIQQRQITSLFQPIFNLSNNSIFAYEALSRAPKDSPLHMPELLFSTAKKYHRLYALDCLCREKSIQNFELLQLGGKLALNIDPHSLMDPNFEKGTTLSLLKEAGIPNSRIILELTEQNRTDCYDEFRQAVQHYRNMGFTIALDDLSAGYSNLRLMAELKPEYLKLDKYFISSIEKNDLAYDFVEVIVNLARRINCKIIAEGIETAEELKTIRKLGIDYAQGYLLGRPAEHPSLSIPNILPETENSLIDTPEIVHTITSKEDKVSSLTLHPIPPCSSDTMAVDILQRFQSNLTLQAIPVIDDHNIIGVLIRESILQAFATTYGHSLNHRATAAKLMHTEPVILKTSDFIIHASEIAMGRPSELIYTPLIVCDNNKYLGTASIRELLASMTQSQIKHARQCSPLTGLPGNISIDNEIDQLLNRQELFICCYFDLDNFKAFNDYYGFERGDCMIRLVADILNKYKEGSDFIGHVGGDDFVFISSRKNWQQSVESCLNDFEQQVPKLYDDQDRKNGGIDSKTRSGEPQTFPFSSLSVGALPCPKGRFSSRLEISSAVFELKHLAKKQVGNSLVIDRREM